jgi:uncharacterized membrane protein YfcA
MSSRVKGKTIRILFSFVLFALGAKLMHQALFLLP